MSSSTARSPSRAAIPTSSTTTNWCGSFISGYRALSNRLLIGYVMADPETIYNWRRLDDRITTSGQRTEPQLADIHALGVRHVINLGLHSHEKALPDEAASVSRLGMTYIHIPVDFQKPTDGDFDQFCSAMAAVKRSPRTRTLHRELQSLRLFLQLSSLRARYG